MHICPNLEVLLFLLLVYLLMDMCTIHYINFIQVHSYVIKETKKIA